MTEYKTTIGLEIHAELKTKTKMFCNSKNDTDEKRPNVNICPICMGYPGTLPTINKEAVRHVLKVGLALGGSIADFTEFDRKNYFYPDIPKGYQISQYKYPIVSGGVLNGVAITRIHLEEDTARSTHDSGNYSLIDFNRAGIPLMELVTEPVITGAEQASSFAKELQLLLQTLGVSAANMEKGEMRVEANISVSGSDALGIKVEVKNLNSFRSVERAIAFEMARHIYLLEKGENVVQETRGFDEVKEETFSQRAKEDSEDYRYFPEPDLPKMLISKVSDFNPEKLRRELPELPSDKRTRYTKKLGLKGEDAEVFVRNKNWDKYFDSVSSVFFKDDLKKLQLAVNYLTTDLAGIIKNDASVNFSTIDISQKISPEHFANLISILQSGTISSRTAKDILKMMYEGEKDAPEIIAEKHNLIQKNDESHLTEIAQGIINANGTVVADYKAGKSAALQFLIGLGMKETKGSANPEILKSIFVKLLSS